MRKLHVVLDTNIVVSAIVYGGNPQIIFHLALDKKILAVISEPLKTELSSILVQKFQYTPDELHVLEKKMKKKFTSVRPNSELQVLKDLPDNRVLEAAVEGKCQVIVTGDKELLALKKYQGINIMTASEFLRQFDAAVPTKTPTASRGFVKT